MDRILALYDDNVEINSSYIVERMGETSGQLTGKKAVNHYWQRSLALQPTIEFELTNVFSACNNSTLSITILAAKLSAKAFVLMPALE